MRRSIAFLGTDYNRKHDELRVRMDALLHITGVKEALAGMFNFVSYSELSRSWLGTSAGIVGTCFGHPLDTIKVRFE